MVNDYTSLGSQRLVDNDGSSCSSQSSDTEEIFNENEKLLLLASVS